MILIHNKTGFELDTDQLKQYVGEKLFLNTSSLDWEGALHRELFELSITEIEALVGLAEFWDFKPDEVQLNRRQLELLSQGNPHPYVSDADMKEWNAMQTEVRRVLNERIIARRKGY